MFLYIKNEFLLYVIICIEQNHKKSRDGAVILSPCRVPRPGCTVEFYDKPTAFACRGGFPCPPVVLLLTDNSLSRLRRQLPHGGSGIGLEFFCGRFVNRPYLKSGYPDFFIHNDFLPIRAAILKTVKAIIPTVSAVFRTFIIFSIFVSRSMVLISFPILIPRCEQYSVGNCRYALSLHS